MLKTVFEKWDELKSSPDNVDRKKLVKPYFLGGKAKANVYFGLDNKKMGIYLEFTKEVLADLNITSIKGMVIKVIPAEFIDEAKMYIYIENSINNEEIFEAFSSSLVDKLATAKSYFDVYEDLIKIVKEYKDYFSNPNVKLSKIEEQGLCAELLELSHLIQLKGEKVIYNWQGPSKNKRDFVFENKALEIKSTLKQEDSSISISNENQLDVSYPSFLEKLFLKIYIMEDADKGININNCIDKILGQIKSIEIRTAFLADLFKMKIDIDKFKAKYNFSIQSENCYLISSDFPSITSKKISSAIFGVTYRIKINQIFDFKIEEKMMDGQL